MSTEFETKLTYNGISFQRSNSTSIAEREIHAYHEILFAMDMKGELLTEQLQKTVQGDALFLFPRGTYHFFRIPDGQKFSRLKIYLPDHILEGTPCTRLFSHVHTIESPDGTILFLLNKLCRIMEEAPRKGQDFHAYSAFLMLLSELDQSLSTPRGHTAGADEELAELLRYISENLSRDLSIEALSKKMRVSPSGITHRFKEKLGISLHRYVTQKRLIYGQSLILAGQKPSKIYNRCGYGDYSSFYKAYVTFFGHPPSSEEKR